ncbi:electron transport complex subunit RsxC [Vibrio algarum]|uniref:Ion-translocating oxidoreductase complex subunit C n=1 Tax=Vibrio algarum TaxID=3020714 RepID=A0ABT4YRF7_9VIBR|nr:electron transport complex subunit RsxC [Vibrio sp. KJ40-1]MDB1124136.1 electron transport complex subunit RsxC [Vibrio sp. KJ40-1]
MKTIFGRPFSGGIHPKTYKSLTKHKGIAKDFWPKNVYLSMQLRNGALLKPVVEVGDRVTRGQLVAVGRSDMIAPVHSPVNGLVTGITNHQTSHPSKAKCETIIIRSNQDKTWGTHTTPGNFYALDSTEIISKIQNAGIVGLGGAGFPTAAKLKFAKQANVTTLVINGGECEPYLTCDDLAMQQYSAEVIAGIRLMLKASGAQQAIIGVEDNKAAALEQLTSYADQDSNIRVMSVPSIYPMGSERHLIKTVTGKTVPLGQLSTQIGILVNNIATARAVYHAVRFNQPLVSRLVTVSGKGIQKPLNIEVPIGTPVREIVEYCGGFSEDTERLIFGGPMMGQVITSPHIPVDKCVGGILALTGDEVKASSQQECIRCGQCVRACPMGLMPFQMAAYSRISDFTKTEQLGVNYCLACGACSYVCPSNIPLVQYFHHAKGAINANKLKEKKSAQAKALTEARKLRLVKEAEAKRAAKAAKAGRRKRPQRASTRNEKVKEVVND